jgi:hypothetical protein
MYQLYHMADRREAAGLRHIQAGCAGRSHHWTLKMGYVLKDFSTFMNLANGKIGEFAPKPTVSGAIRLKWRGRSSNPTTEP